VINDSESTENFDGLFTPFQERSIIAIFTYRGFSLLGDA
jgi:hypothetical protein